MAVESSGNWKRMSFKGNKVWVETGADGRLSVNKGLIRMKFQLNQEQEYQVREEMIRPLEEARSAPAVKSPPPKKTRVANQTKSPSIPPNAVCIYTDGASSGNPGPAGIGVFLRHGEHEKQISRYIGVSTNNIAELEAIRTGLAEVKNRKLPVRVFTDSGYAYGLLVLGWKPKKNLELVEEIQQLAGTFSDIGFIKVRGHAGHPENEKADFLATSAIQNRLFDNDPAT